MKQLFNCGFRHRAAAALSFISTRVPKPSPLSLTQSHTRAYSSTNLSLSAAYSSAVSDSAGKSKEKKQRSGSKGTSGMDDMDPDEDFYGHRRGDFKFEDLPGGGHRAEMPTPPGDSFFKSMSLEGPDENGKMCFSLKLRFPEELEEAFKKQKMAEKEKEKK